MPNTTTSVRYSIGMIEEKKQKRQEASRPILDAFWAWVEETSALATTNEKLTQALGYSKNQKKYLETFLEDGRLPISNNLCEANIKPFATARRAWLFADTPKGGKCNPIYSGGKCPCQQIRCL